MLRRTIRYASVTHNKISELISQAADEISKIIDLAEIDISACMACASKVQKRLLYLINRKRSEALLVFKVLILYSAGHRPNSISQLLNTNDHETIIKYYSIFIKKCPRNRVFKPSITKNDEEELLEVDDKGNAKRGRQIHIEQIRRAKGLRNKIRGSAGRG
jgi:uncharacterized membrane protein YheB (UPF0754 family)